VGASSGFDVPSRAAGRSDGYADAAFIIGTVTDVDGFVAYRSSVARPLLYDEGVPAGYCRSCIWLSADRGSYWNHRHNCRIRSGPDLARPVNSRDNDPAVYRVEQNDKFWCTRFLNRVNTILSRVSAI